jgi:hypothetical protein
MQPSLLVLLGGQVRGRWNSCLTLNSSLQAAKTRRIASEKSRDSAKSIGSLDRSEPFLPGSAESLLQ